MKKITILLFGLSFLIISIPIILTRNKAVAQSKNEYVKGEILVKFQDTATNEYKNEVHKRLGSRVKETIPGINVQVVEIGRKNVGEAVSIYAREGKVDFVEPNYISSALTDDAFFTKQWALNNTGQETCNTANTTCTTGTFDADIDALEAWNLTTGNLNIKIAILDSGIDQDHPDLSGKIIANKDFSESGTIDDNYGHGTHVAGIAAAITNNTQGVAGVGYQSTLMNFKVLGDDGYGSNSWIANGIIWAADNGADVINMSLGSSFRSTTLENAVKYAWGKGKIIVAAAGNSANSSRTYPAYYANCIAVAATTNNDVKASFSSYGSWVDVSAPGENIYSTFPNHPFYLQTVYGRSNNYDFGNGTSMSTPHVSGLAALIWGKEPSLTNLEVRERIETTADKIVGTGTYWVWGRINACNAVGGNCSGFIPSPTPTTVAQPSPTSNPNLCSDCFKGVCDGVCHPKKDGLMCQDCL